MEGTCWGLHRSLAVPRCPLRMYFGRKSTAADAEFESLLSEAKTLNCIAANSDNRMQHVSETTRIRRIQTAATPFMCLQLSYSKYQQA